MKTILILTDEETDNLMATSIRLLLENRMYQAEIKSGALDSINNLITLDERKAMTAVVILSANMRKAIEAVNMFNEDTVNTMPLVIINVENLSTGLVSMIDFKNNVRICSIWSVADDLIKLLTTDYGKIHLCSYNNNWIIETLVTHKSHANKKELNNTEQEIVRCAKAGMLIKETAQTLNLSVNTIAAYRTKITRKLGYTSMRQLCADNNSC